MVHPYSSMDTATSWKKSHFSFSEWSDFHIIDNQFIYSCVHFYRFQSMRYFCRGIWTGPLISAHYVLAVLDERSKPRILGTSVSGGWIGVSLPYFYKFLATESHLTSVFFSIIISFMMLFYCKINSNAFVLCMLTTYRALYCQRRRFIFLKKVSKIFGVSLEQKKQNSKGSK